jgi:hypothetical protein
MWKKDKEEPLPPDSVEITFYFVSGDYMPVLFTHERLKDFMEKLNRGWAQMIMTSDNYGINFALVTHFKKTRG